MAVICKMRTIAQETGRTAMRTLYDGFTFEAIRESETFQYGGFTVRTSPGAVLPSQSTPGVIEEGRFRQVTEGYSTWLGNSPPPEQRGGTAPPEYRYVGINATLYANGEAVAMNRLNTDTYAGGTVYFGKDVLGSVRGISNDYGLLEDRYEYDAFGKPYKGDLNSGMNLGYTGKPYDMITGMYNYGYRDYQPEVARFTTVDPVRDGANWFAYVNNDPVNWVDLWGLETLQLGGSVTVGSGAGTTVGGGLVIGWDPSDPLTIEIGGYTTVGGGAHVGYGGSATFDVATSTNPKASDLDGKSLVSGGSASVTPIIGVAAERVTSLEGKAPATSASIGYTAGSPYEVHNYYTETKTATISISINPIVDVFKSAGSAILDFLVGQNKW
jgi:RHS repeat-associated protein